MANKTNDKEIYCSFCGKPQDMVLRMIQGNGAYNDGNHGRDPGGAAVRGE